MTVSIRPATPRDAPALSHVCLHTADAGASAAHLLTRGALPGLVWAVPYVAGDLPGCAGWVLVDDHAGDKGKGQGEGEEVVGYTVICTDTEAYEEAAGERWFPPLRLEYPLHLSPSEPSTTPDRYSGVPLTFDDVQFLRQLHWPPRAPSACLALSPAHMHINILPPYQRRGWGRRLVRTAVHACAAAGVRAVWLGTDARNEGARQFYRRVGFRDVEGVEDYLVLRIEEWVDPPEGKGA